MRLLRLNNKTGEPIQGAPPNQQAIYSENSIFNCSLNYPLTLSPDSEIGLLDCVIELPNNYIFVPTNRSRVDDVGFPINFRISIRANHQVKVFLFGGYYTIPQFKNMIEWGLNGSTEFQGVEDRNTETGFNFSCPTYELQGFNIYKQPVLKIQWDRSDPRSWVDDGDLNLIDMDYNPLAGHTLTALNDVAIAKSKTYFTKGAGILQMTVDLTGADPTEGGYCTMGLLVPQLAYDNLFTEQQCLISCSVVPNVANDGFVYSISKYLYTLIPSSYFTGPQVKIEPYDYVAYITWTAYPAENLIRTFIPNVDGAPLPVQTGDIIQIISTTTENQPNFAGGNYVIQIVRDGEPPIILDEIPKPSFLMWNCPSYDYMLVYINPNDGITYERNFNLMTSVKDMQGIFELKQNATSCSNILMTKDPFHIVDNNAGTHINMRDMDIDMSVPSLQAIIPSDVYFYFRNAFPVIWRDLFQMEKNSFVYPNSTRGALTGLKPINYNRLRFPINILIDNLDLESYDTSILDKENLLFCLTESNISPFDELGNILAVKYTCQNKPLMISLKNKSSVVLNKLKMRLTDNYYNTFLLNTTKETHLNVLVSSLKNEKEKS